MSPVGSGRAECEGAGDPCACDEGAEGRAVCEGDALRCACDDDDTQGDNAQKKDAGPRRDAGKRDAASDAGDDMPAADASTGTEGDAAAASEDAGTTPAPRIPALPDDCPNIETGTVTVLGQAVQLWVGARRADTHGPILFYWHGEGTSAPEALTGLGLGHAAILAEGGVVASFTTSTRSGQTTGSSLWSTGDFEMADRILACAIVQQGVDPRRIYTAGCGPGGLQASAMVYGRSSYLAAGMASSGGIAFPLQLDDPGHIPAFIGAHGAAGTDVRIVDFAQATTRQVRELAAQGGLAVACDHGGGTCASPASLKNAQWKFLLDHPFGVSPEPYEGGLPAAFPEYCQIAK